MRVRLFLLAAAAAAAVGGARAELVGLVQQASGAGSLTVRLASVNQTSGEMRPYGEGASSEGEAQGLSVADASRSVVYFVGANLTTGRTNLVGLNTLTGNVVHDVALPFAAGPFVGLGNDLALDETTGEVIVCGHKNAASGAHTVLAWSPSSGVFREVVTIKGADIVVMGATSTFDDKRGIMYTQFAQNTSGHVYIGMYAIGTRAGTPGVGKFEVVPTDASQGHALSAMKYDRVTDTLVGFSLDPTTHKREVVRLSCGPLGSGARTWTKVGDVANWGTEDGPIIAISSSNQQMFAIIQPAPTGPQTYVNSTSCDSCASSSKCCRDPTVPSDDGACFKVSSCSQIHTGAGGLNTSEPFHLVQMDLKASATVSAAPPLCTMKAQNCPWSLDML